MDIHDPRTRHAAAHAAGGTDQLSPKDIGAGATPQMVVATSTSLDITIGLSNQAIVPLLLRHVVTNSGVNTATGTITFSFEGEADLVVASATDATAKTLFATWDSQGLVLAVYNAVSTEELFPFVVEAFGASGTATAHRLQTIRIQTTGTGATSSVEYRYFQM